MKIMSKITLIKELKRVTSGKIQGDDIGEIAQGLWEDSSNQEYGVWWSFCVFLDCLIVLSLCWKTSLRWVVKHPRVFGMMNPRIDL